MRKVTFGLNTSFFNTCRKTEGVVKIVSIHAESDFPKNSLKV
ncbi:MAG: hypothetical protein UV58_C0009G0010 [Candidatus Wolfebacteria bacterium GW2011_GWC1_43_10]|uniref:Uncharacterized protein n=1 Tax=Candidatus Wolfebacteria bacterium GW2011_GWC1_43_10 TaxID=1619011 RepID=A0A0G1F6N1_9BACT|nr:MAG: hypothetical protein UV58_C0009G0010 [Candidatus Wolfebacteria bacterium GW2011_GWC1_43_10]KKT23123.1 MAG: hypothetical protein UW08_C0001G0086 [Parcubacteria group bacterium GW2011_GWB1_43_8b]KKT85610.1 MAG: hypothetical protein UW85_C0017G0014 [Parcubacteria group bacterium GW2011_GWA1_Parcubacteria_45_10]